MATDSEVMQTVRNSTSGDLVLPDGVIVPAGKSVAADLAPHLAHPVVAAWVASGALAAVGPASESGDEDDKPAPKPRKR